MACVMGACEVRQRREGKGYVKWKMRGLDRRTSVQARKAGCCVVHSLRHDGGTVIEIR